MLHAALTQPACLAQREMGSFVEARGAEPGRLTCCSESGALRAQIYTLLEDYDEAITVYADALQQSPENADVLTTLGLLYLRWVRGPGRGRDTGVGRDGDVRTEAEHCVGAGVLVTLGVLYLRCAGLGEGWARKRAEAGRLRALTCTPRLVVALEGSCGTRGDADDVGAGTHMRAHGGSARVRRPQAVHLPHGDPCACM